MTTELKTLKDLRKEDEFVFEKVYTEDLKQMAIEWVKNLKDEIKLVPLATVKRLIETRQPTEKVIREFIHLEVDKESQIKLVVKIFNLTEEDLTSKEKP